MTFGEKLQRLRKAKGWTQEELAAQISISRQALSKWEQGTAIPDTENILQISKIFGVSTDYLLNDDYESDADIPAVQISSSKLNKKHESRLCTIFGSAVSLIGLISFVVLYIVSMRSSVTYPSNGTGEGIDSALGFGVFISTYQLGWLVVLCIAAFVLGFLIVIVPKISNVIRRRKKAKSSR